LDPARLHESEELAIATFEERVADTPPFFEIDLLNGHETEAEHILVEGAGSFEVERREADV
jgi:hypothetical protein